MAFDGAAILEKHSRHRRNKFSARQLCSRTEEKPNQPAEIDHHLGYQEQLQNRLR